MSLAATATSTDTGTGPHSDIGMTGLETEL